MFKSQKHPPINLYGSTKEQISVHNCNLVTAFCVLQGDSSLQRTFKEIPVVSCPVIMASRRKNTGSQGQVGSRPGTPVCSAAALPTAGCPCFPFPAALSRCCRKHAFPCTSPRSLHRILQLRAVILCPTVCGVLRLHCPRRRRPCQETQ